MKLLRNMMKPLSIMSAAAFLVAVAGVPVGQAALVGTDRVVQEDRAAGARDRVAAFLAREDVRARIGALGVAPEEAEARVAALSDAEVDRIAGQIDSMPAGKGVIEVILIVFLVLLLTDILGFTNVFGFTKKGSARP